MVLAMVRSMRGVVTPAYIAATALMAASMMTSSAMADTPNEIHVSGQSTLHVAPDMATIQADLVERTPGVPRDGDRTSNAQALTQARQHLEERFSTLYQKIESAGIPEKDIQAGSLSVAQEQYTHFTDSKNHVNMVRTRLERPLTLTVHDLDKVPALLDALTSANVDQLSGVHYGLSHPEKAQDEALHQALVRAKDKARIMATSLGVSLGQVISVEQVGGQLPRPMVMMARAAPASNASSTVDYHQGQISLESSVNVVWGIHQ